MERMAMVVLSGYPTDPRVRREAEALERVGVEVDVYCTRRDGEAMTERIGSVTAYRLIRHRDDKESIRKYLWFTIVFMGAVFPVLLFRSIFRNYHCIQIHNMPDYLVLLALPQKLAGLPLILDLHDLSVELFTSKWSGRAVEFVGVVVRFVEHLACRMADAVITTSSGFRDALVERGVPPGKITLVLNTVDSRIFTFSSRQRPHVDGEVRLLYHGTVARRFGVDCAVRAVSLLRAKHPGVRLDIYGRYDPSYRVELEKLVRELGLVGSVNLNGYLTLEQVRSIIGVSDFGLVPYRDDAFMHLALSTKTFEYVASGLPVIAARMTSIERLFDDACVEYFTPDDPADCAKAVRRLITDPGVARDRTMNAHAAYRQIDWTVMEARYLRLVNRMMGVSEDGVVVPFGAAHGDIRSLSRCSDDSGGLVTRKIQ